MIRKTASLFLLVPLSFAGSAVASECPPQSEDFILYPSVLSASGGVLCGAPDYDLMYTLGEEVVGASSNSGFKLWSGLRFQRRINVLCPTPTAVEEPGAAMITATMLHPAYPNPVAGDLRMHYHIREPGRVRLSIHDIQGRQIRAFDHGPLRPGRHELVWDGRDGNGNTIATGLYFVRLAVHEAEHVKRVVVLR